MNSLEVTFIVPTLNEKQNIDKILTLILKTIANLKISYEIIFVDDESNDGTIEKIDNLIKQHDNIKLIVNENRQGLGFALLLGMSNSNGNYIIFLDCDVSTNFNDLSNLIENRDKDVMLIGSRYLKESNIIGVKLYKSFLSKILNYFVSIIFNLKIIDVSHSFRIFPNYKKKLNIKTFTHPGFFWELSILFNKSGVLKEIPVTFVERSEGITKNRIIKMVNSIFDFILNIYKK